MSTWVVAVIAIASVTATCLFCVRPMLRRRSHRGAPGGRADLDRQITELRDDVRVLRAQEMGDGER